MEQTNINEFKEKLKQEVADAKVNESEFTYLLEGTNKFFINLDSKEIVKSKYKGEDQTHYIYDYVVAGEVKKLKITSFAYTEFMRALAPIIDTIESTIVEVDIKVEKQDNKVNYMFVVKSTSQ